MVLSTENGSDALLGSFTYNDPPEVREQAMRMAINVVAYAMMQ